MEFLADLIKRDFKKQYRFFKNKVGLQMQVSKGIFSSGRQRRPGVLLKTFKIKADNINSTANLISNGTLTNLCYESRCSLRELSLRCAIHLKPEGLVSAISELYQLQKLDLSYTKIVNDDVVLAIAENNGDQLQSLALRCLPEISAVSIRAIVRHVPNLRQLDISGCVNIDLDTFSQFK